jgi:hydrogenase expression/formation protein HypD
MKFIDEFRNKNLIRKVSERIKEIMPSVSINIMEVCGTHTQNFCKFGLNKFLPGNLRLIAGPGCPVCVSSQQYIDAAIQLSREKDTIILTFGDMLCIPGTNSSLEREKARGARVNIVYSALDSLKFARENPSKKIIFLAVGFETTAPTIALSIIKAKKEGLKNLSFFSALKLIPPVMRHLVTDHELKLHGFLCPGHVSAIIGTRPYEFISDRYGIPCCVAGFEPLDILEGLYILLVQIAKNKPTVENQYMRVVTKSGNRKATNLIYKVFKVADTFWRGFDKVPQSGLSLKEIYSRFDTERVFSVELKIQEPKGKTPCRCGDVLKGLIFPRDCPLFLKVCNPQNPVGPCMVSSEGACNAYYRYKRKT